MVFLCSGSEATGSRCQYHSQKNGVTLYLESRRTSWRGRTAGVPDLLQQSLRNGVDVADQIDSTHIGSAVPMGPSLLKSIGDYEP